MSLTSVLEKTFDSSKSCRICMTQSVKMSDIFNKNDENLTDKIEFCTGIMFKNEDGLPKSICKSCLRSLSVAHKFKTLCLLSEQMCQTILHNKIKEEFTDNIANCDNDDYGGTDNESGCSDVGTLVSHIQSVKGVADLKEEVKVESNYTDGEEVKTKLVNGHEVKRRQRLVKRRKIAETTMKVVKKRGPYKKKGPPRIRKYKFKKLTCEPCGLKFDSKQESDEHKQCMHKDVSYMCEVCGKTFLHRGSHYTHVRSHMPPSLACDHCDYRTSNKYDLQKHVRIHLGVKKYVCAMCSASYHTSSNLLDHERRFHQRLRRFPCPLCERRFYDRTKLNLHVDSHNDIKRFECSVCHTAFTRRCYWKKHLERQHSVVVPALRPGRQRNTLALGDITLIHKSA